MKRPPGVAAGNTYSEGVPELYVFSQIAKNVFPSGERPVWPDENSVGAFLGTALGKAFAVGAMLYVVVEELVPEYSQGNHSNVGTIGLALG